MLSLSTAKSGALIGVLISVTTIPAAANLGIALAFEDWDTAMGSAGQLLVNLAGILVAGTLTLYVQRLLYRRRRRRHRASARGGLALLLPARDLGPAGEARTLRQPAGPSRGSRRTRSRAPAHGRCPPESATST